MDYKEFLVPVEIAEALKKIGFDKDDDEVIKLYEYESRKIVEPTWEVHYRSSYFSYYLDHPKEFCPLFTYEQVFAWFREKGLEFNMGPYYDGFITERLGFYYEIVALEDERAGEDDCTFENGCREFTFIEEERFETYEDAQSGVLNKLIEIYEEENSKKL